MKGVNCIETSIKFCQITRYHITQDNIEDCDVHFESPHVTHCKSLQNTYMNALPNLNTTLFLFVHVKFRGTNLQNTTYMNRRAD
jgi:hypothetical protein